MTTPKSPLLEEVGEAIFWDRDCGCDICVDAQARAKTKKTILRAAQALVDAVAEVRMEPFQQRSLGERRMFDALAAFESACAEYRK